MTIEDIQKGGRSLIYYHAFILSFLFGIFITNIQGEQFLYIFLIIIVILLNAITYKWKALRFSVIILIWLSIWYILSINNYNSINLRYSTISNFTANYKNKINVEGLILDNYRQWDFSNIFIIKVQKINNQDIEQNISILGTINNKISVHNWDIISFDSRLFKINNFNWFQYDKYLLLNDIMAQTNIYQFTKKWNKNNYYNNFILSFRDSIEKVIKNIFPWDTSKLLSGILLGQKWNYSKELKADFNNSWLSHIITVSWYNITLIIIFLNVFLKYLPKIIKITLISLFLIFFITLIWDNLPAIRAWLMWIIWYTTMSYWRKINIFSVLLFIITILAVFNPLILNYDIWFQLSILALIWLIILNSKISEYFWFITNKLQIKESLTSTISVTIFTLPIILINFGKISIISIISNLLVLPVVSISMFTWTIAIIIYYLNQTLWIFVWYMAYIFLKYILIIVWFFWKISFATININLWECWILFIIGYYFLLTYLILNTKRNT